MEHNLCSSLLYSASSVHCSPIFFSGAQRWKSVSQDENGQNRPEFALIRTVVLILALGQSSYPLFGRLVVQSQRPAAYMSKPRYWTATTDFPWGCSIRVWMCIRPWGLGKFFIRTISSPFRWRFSVLLPLNKWSFHLPQWPKGQYVLFCAACFSKIRHKKQSRHTQ